MSLANALRVLGCLCLYSASLSPMFAENIKVDNEHVRSWNAFAINTLKLHEQQVSQRPHRKEVKTGGYAQMPDFYTEERFYDKQGGQLLSVVQWERENPEQLHAIEVYVYDSQGRVLRDYAAAYLPLYHNAPSQTLISLHAYTLDLHAFRSFDASGAHILDRCQGSHGGKAVDILLDEDEIYEAMDETQGIMQTEEYRECFKTLSTEIGRYVTPQ